MKRTVLLSLFLYLVILPLTGQIDITQAYYSISVVGAVKNPGIYHLPPTSRVSEAVAVANRVVKSLPEIESEEEARKELEKRMEKDEYVLYQSLFDKDLTRPNPSKRNISLRREGEEIKLDLLRFYRLGAEEENPYLEDGDIVIVPASLNSVVIYGAVNQPGEYELLEGDRLSDIVELALGLSDDAYRQKAEIIRYDEQGKDFTRFDHDLSPVLSGDDSESNLILQNGDRIFIREIPEFHQEQIVNITGEVKFPGLYMIQEEVTTLSMLIEIAGGLTEEADLERAFLQRKELEEESDPEFDRLKRITVTEMTYLEYEYFKAKIREIKGKFSLDFTRVFSGEADITLRDQDYIHIPDRINSVIVSGHVQQPGFVEFKPGMDYKFYIEKAGGYSWRVKNSKIRLIKGSTGEILKPEGDTLIEAGDTIFVPEKPEYNYWEITKEVITVLSQLATLFLVIQTTSN